MTAPYDAAAISKSYFFPRPPTPLPVGERAAPLTLTSADGSAIEAFWSRPLDAAPTILYLHGNGEAIDDQLEHWPAWARQAGANILFVNYPGYGNSGGRASLSSCRAAARAAWDHLVAQPTSEVPTVFVAGRSVGSIFALDLAATVRSPRLAGVLIESGVADVAERLAMRVSYSAAGLDRAEVERALAEDFDLHSKIAALGAPVLILHTEHDDLVAADNALRLGSWAGEWLFRLVMFEAGDHNSIQALNAPAYQRHLAQFVDIAHKVAMQRGAPGAEA